MEDRERNGRLSPEIYVYATNKNFLNLYDALRIDKVKLEIAGYDPATNRQTGQATAWLDVDDCRLLCHLAAHRLFKPVTGGKWEKFGGSQREDGSIESRTISVEWDEGDNGRFARYPYRITIANGPGRKTQTGGVSPDGPARLLLSMRLPESDMIKVMLALGDYIHAYEAAHHHRIVADRVRELRDKLAVRSERHETPVRRAFVARTETREAVAARPDHIGQPYVVNTDGTVESAKPGHRIAEPGPQPRTQTPPPLQAIPGGASRPMRAATNPNPNGNRGHLTPLRTEREAV